MKLKKLAALCAQSKSIRLYDKVSTIDGSVEQWVGDGFALYLLSGLPYMDKDNIFILFDVPENKKEDYSFHHEPMPDSIRVNDFVDDDWLLEKVTEMQIVHQKQILQPLHTTQGILFIQSKFLAPLGDASGTMELYARGDARHPRRVAVKVGMVLVALIAPNSSLFSQGTVEGLEQITQRCREQWWTMQQQEETSPIHEVTLYDTAWGDEKVGHSTIEEKEGAQA